MADEALRTACFDDLKRLLAAHGPDIPYRGGIDAGFAYGGKQIPFMTPYKGHLPRP